MEALILFALFLTVICNLIIAVAMEEAAKKKGYGKESRIFILCFLFGIFGCLYVIALPDLKQRKRLDKIIKLLDPQVPSNPPQQDVAWKLTELTPETPKKDGRAEEYLREIGMTPEEYTCDSLAIVGTDERGECSVCKQKQKTTRHCRIKRNNIFSDIPICTDCINAFTEYNPTSVFDLEPK